MDNITDRFRPYLERVVQLLPKLKGIQAEGSGTMLVGTNFRYFFFH